jgi:hypothetical protein
MVITLRGSIRMRMVIITVMTKIWGPIGRKVLARTSEGTKERQLQYSKYARQEMCDARES